jgi:hypothetical protein
MRAAVETYADVSIRRACGFAGLAVTTVMMGLSYDMALSFRIGAEMLALLVLGLVFAALRAPRRNLRHSEVYALLRDAGLPRSQLASREMQDEIALVLRDRLYWHAERIGAVALGLWGASALLALIG